MIDVASAMDDSFWIATLFALGLCFGSFVTLVSYRLIHGGAIVNTRSQCPVCHTTLSPLDLVPLFSWLCSKGKCRHCHNHISKRYPLTELATAALFLLSYMAYGASLHTIVLCSAAVALMVMIVVDLEHQIIPDEVQICIALLSIPYAYLWELDAIPMLIMAASLGAFSYGLRYVFWLWKKKEALGLGDVKFFIVSGLYLPFEAIASYLFIAGASGMLLGLAWRIMGFGERFPFGPSLAIAFFLCIAYPEYSYEWLTASKNYAFSS